MSSKSLARPIEHAEYLKIKYGIGSDDSSKKSKKRRVVPESKKSNLRIFDDDIDLVKINVKKETEDSDIYYGVEEDKPVIEEVIDERPLSVKNLEKRGTKWKPLADDEKPDGDDKQKNKSSEEGKRVTHGLTSAAVMREERKRLKEEEAALFKKLGSEILGKDAKSVYRDKKTGRVRDLEKEEQEKKAKEKEQEEKEAKEKQKFKEMSAGIKQVEEKKVQLDDELYEMSKPFSRYEDDADRDDFLRSREIEGDPMLAYIRKKKEKAETSSTEDKKVKLKYKGPPPPLNRFNIPPGHRWDGVDRSNGYEKKYFQKQAEKTAVQEEAYRWATEDM